MGGERNEIRDQVGREESTLLQQYRIWSKEALLNKKKRQGDKSGRDGENLDQVLSGAK